MIEKGTVISVTNGRAKVEIRKPPNRSCGSCCACASLGAGRMEIEMEVPPDTKPGDRVTIDVPLPSPTMSALLLLLFPLVLFGIGMGLGQWLGTAGIVSAAQEVSILLGFALMMGWYFILWVVERFRRSSQKRTVRLVQLERTS